MKVNYRDTSISFIGLSVRMMTKKGAFSFDIDDYLQDMKQNRISNLGVPIVIDGNKKRVITRASYYDKKSGTLKKTTPYDVITRAVKTRINTLSNESIERYKAGGWTITKEYQKAKSGKIYSYLKGQKKVNGVRYRRHFGKNWDDINAKIREQAKEEVYFALALCHSASSGLTSTQKNTLDLILKKHNDESYRRHLAGKKVRPEDPLIAKYRKQLGLKIVGKGGSHVKFKCGKDKIKRILNNARKAMAKRYRLQVIQKASAVPQK